MLEVQVTPSFCTTDDPGWYVWPLVVWNQGMVRRGSRVWRRDHLKFQVLFLRLILLWQFELPATVVRQFRLLDRLADADAQPST